MNKKFTFWCSFRIHTILLFLFLSTSISRAQIAKGADVGWLSYFENSLGITYLNDNGQEQDALEILKDHDLNAVRLRAFVNPTETHIGEVDTQNVVKNAVRAKNLGMDVMITIHYSDTWADPGKQYKPASWQNLSFEDLKQAVYDYTYNFMDAMLTAGVVPKWVQVGNETDPGFIWEDGRLTESNNFANMNNYVALSNRGYDAIKDRSPNTQVITHIAGSTNASRLFQYFDRFYEEGGKNDIIGVSYYPRWHGGTVNEVGQNLKTLINRFDKDVMICEIGYFESEPEFMYNLIVDAINMIESIPNNRGLGVFHWEPIAHTSINGYEQGLAIPYDDDIYKLSWVLDAFEDGAQNCTATETKPLYKINNRNWIESTNVLANEGNKVLLSPDPKVSTGWTWRGPNGFTSNSREITFNNISFSNSGAYVATYIPQEGCPASIEYDLVVLEQGEVFIENAGFENGTISPWTGIGNYGIDTDLINSGIYSGWFGGGNSELTQTVSGLKPNTTYEFTSYIRNWTGNNGVVTTGVRNYGDTEASTTIGLTGNNGNDFEKATVTFTTGNTSSLEVFAHTTKLNTWGKIDDVKIVEKNALSTNSFHKNTFKLYPNPTKSKVSIQINENVTNLEVIIYNVLGKKLITKKINALQNNKFELDTSTLNTGVYFVEITNQTEKSIQKLIIE